MQIKSLVSLLAAVIAIAPFSYAQTKHLSKESGNGDLELVKKEHFSIYYKHTSTEIDSNYLYNRQQLDRIKFYLQNSPRIDSITIYSFTSPEGSWQLNNRLSKGRGQSAKQLLLSLSPDSSKLNSSMISINSQVENWQGLIDAVEEKYNLDNREQVLSILKDASISNDRRKARLQQLDKGKTWRYLINNYMPELRAAKWVCVWVKTDEPEGMITPQLDRSTLALPAYANIAPEPVVGYATEALTYPDTLEAEPEKYKTILALKSNLLYDAATVLNWAIEIPFNKNFSLQLQHHFPWWLSKNNKHCLQHLSLGAEFRWWFAPKPKEETEKRKSRDVLMGHFLGVHGWAGYGDIQWGRDFGCYQYEFWSAGLTYGYAFPVSRSLNMEFSISGGYMRIPYQHYIPSDDWQILIKDKNKAGTLSYFGLTKAEVSLVIPIRTKIKK